MNQIDWIFLFETYYKACTMFFFYMQKDIYIPQNQNIDYSIFKVVLDNSFPCGIKSDDLFSFFDENDILVGAYPKYHKNIIYYTSFAQSSYSIKICNDLYSRDLANIQTIKYGFEILNEKLERHDIS
jgi:hypothetical protein